MTDKEFAETYKGWRVKFFGATGRIIGYNGAGHSILIEPDLGFGYWDLHIQPQAVVLCKDAQRGYWISQHNIELICPPEDKTPLPLPG